MRSTILALAALTVLAPAADAQPQLTTPRVSPHARVQQTIGLTDVSVDFHRPAVNGRRVWGDLVPFGEVWRAGANENTVFETSTEIAVEGQPLAAGRYGLHTIPTEEGWTVIFSNMADAWGSYTYDPTEDVLRVEVTPREGPMTERLAYRFDDPDEESATLVLAWETLEVPVALRADTDLLVLANMERELRGLAGFYPEGWNQIAVYALNSGRRLDDALAWAERSIEMQASFGNTMTKAGLLAALDRAAEAGEAEAQAFALATEDEIRAFARQRRRAGDDAAADAALARIADLP